MLTIVCGHKVDATIPEWLIKKFVDPGFSSKAQLFDLKVDPSEEYNIAYLHPDLVNKMQKELNSILAGRK